MPETATPDSAGAAEIGGDRLLGRYRGRPDGPLLVCVGGLHGNEPAGVDALRRVIVRLEERRPPFRGELVALVGNRAALDRGQRFLDRDLNRMWTLARVAELRRGSRSGDGSGSDGGTGSDGSSEAREMARLLTELERLFAGGAEREICCLDLHTTSSDSVPFLTFSDSLHNREFARRFPVPLVLGVEEEIEGTLLDYVDHLGHVALCVEGGSHRDPASVDHLERAVWLALVALGMVEPSAAPEPEALRERLDAASGDVPSLFEVRYRHALRQGDGFRMEPGYRNFQPVEEGEVVARDRNGPVRVPEGGRIFLPLYQAKGEEGFFVVRPVAPFWLGVSALLRRIGADRMARWFPGVDPHPEREETLVVHPRLSGSLSVKVFHLLGYRRERPEGGRLVLTRRKEAEEVRSP